ncbi:hypothetical protein AB4Y30_02815 [Ornithinibacillus sp. 4-3]|uniref:Uncharacterized protein n=1 Tax=Ornithinibacillus sp. 4-3 TaxID=3231488 RepID=A0AB39HN01_9BACI
MKRYLSACLIVISLIIIVIGLRAEVSWGGIASSGIAFILLILALYFTKYISRSNTKD